ncbi:calcium-binding protein [Solirubrobacter soli]|uniref:calcium-binding protein n=1 Tax=Solirubrobacter soli TaxID=363832 RepID=UPI0003FD931F|nr:calcium-binding protein [Solirubrobacter soli]
MPSHRVVAVCAGVLALAFPTAAQAGSVSNAGGSNNVYEGSVDPEEVTISTSGGQTRFVSSGIGLGPGAVCLFVDGSTLDCTTTPMTTATTLGGDDRIDASLLTGSSLQAIGGAGGDYILDGAGNDSIDGGPGNDVNIAGRGTDVFAGGDGDDTVDYSNRTAPVTVRLNGTAVSGEAGENDTIGADVEGAIGGSGNDVLVANPLGNRLSGGGGNDTITGGAGEDTLNGNEGDDTIDARDGRFDAIDCGPGNDTVLADIGDSAANCEVAPDRDGDGTPNEQDCAPDNAAIHPGAGEIVGNNVDEDCKDGPQYLRVTAPLSYSTARKGNSAKFTKLTLSEIKADDKIEVRCSGGKSKACPFSKKTQTGKAGKSKVNLVSLLKKRYLKLNAVLEIRVTRPNEIGRVVRLKIGKRGVVKQEGLCVAVGATKPTKCS